jgi:Tol biopolymer transport system component
MVATGISPAVSTDGKTLALLQRNYNPAPPYGAYEVLSVGPISALLPVTVKQVTTAPLSTASPTFSPDSTEIAFCTPTRLAACPQIAVGPPAGPWRNVTVQPLLVVSVGVAR